MVIEGTVNGSGVVALVAELEVDGTTLRHRDVHGITMTVGTNVVTIDLTADAELLPREQRRGTWDELSELPAAAPFRDKRPAPDARAVLRWTQIEAGERVAVRGAVIEMASKEAGYRDAPVEHVRKLRADAIARGEEAVKLVTPPEERVKKRVRPRQPPAMPWVVACMLGFGIVVVALGLALVRDTAHRFDIVVFGTGVVLMALVFQRGARPMRRSDYAQDAEEDPWRVTRLAIWFALPAFFFLMPLGDMPDNIENGHRVYSGMIAIIGWPIWMACALMFLLRWELPNLRNARRLLGAARHASSPRDDEWGVSEEQIEGGDGLFEKFALVREDGARIAVDPAGGTSFAPWRSAGRVRALVLGRMRVVDGVASLVAGTGRGSLVVFRAARPRLVLRLHLWTTVALIALIGAYMAVLVGVAFHHPFLPEFYLAPGD